jgi:hypothetical protein
MRGYTNDGQGATLDRLLGAAAEAYEAGGHPAAIAAAGVLRALPAPDLPPTGARPKALADLDAALAGLAADGLGTLLRDLAPRLPWVESSLPMPGPLVGRYSYVDIAGPDALIVTQALGFGLYLQRRDTVYPAHAHAAEEFYLVLSGTAAWQKGDGAFAEQPPGRFIHHRPDERHAVTTGPEPLLAMWLWTGDLDETSYRIDGV